MEITIDVLYIVGIGHSGSTMLDLLLDSSDDIVSGGEVKQWVRSKKGVPAGDRACTCGTKPLRTCEFWSAVDKHANAESGRSIHDLDPSSEDPDRFAADNRLLFSSMLAASGASVVLDSSKNQSRLHRLAKVPGFRVHAVWLRRDARGVMASAKRRDRSVAFNAAKILRSDFLSLGALDAAHASLSLTYEQLCHDTVESVTAVRRMVGLDPVPVALGWRSAEHHLMDGNDVRRQDATAIVEDLSWNERLNAVERVGGRLVNAVRTRFRHEPSSPVR